jgi:hypothetical protein
MNNNRFYPHLTMALVICGIPAKTAHADIIFSDNFNYANGQLAGNNGGTGWSGVWSGGTGSNGNLVSDPLSGTVGKSIKISSGNLTTTRSLISSLSTETTQSMYISFLFNANPYQGFNAGKYAGITLSSSSSSLFLGMPGSSAALGFDWANYSDGLYNSASNGTTYLTLFEITKGSVANSAIVKMYATNNLLMSGADLINSGSLASFDNTTDSNRSAITIDSVSFSGAYDTGTINLAGLAMATTANEAVAFTHAAVPEPGTLLLGSLAATLGGCGIRRNRRKKLSPLPAV